MVISKETYSNWLQQPSDLAKDEVDALNELLGIFPFCQTNHLLYAKGLQNVDSLHFNQTLKKTAAYAGDRHQLFHLLTDKTDGVKKEVKAKPIATKNDKTSKKDAKKELKIGQPIGFDKDEKHSFIEWLKLSKAKPITRHNTQNSLQQKVSLIEGFIAKRKPHISKTDFFSATNQAKKSESFNFDIVTETLAKVYLEQEHYEKAKQAYQLLSLKYPQKSSLFASQIELIDTLIKTNN